MTGYAPASRKSGERVSFSAIRRRRRFFFQALIAQNTEDTFQIHRFGVVYVFDVFFKKGAPPLGSISDVDGHGSRVAFVYESDPPPPPPGGNLSSGGVGFPWGGGGNCHRE